MKHHALFEKGGKKKNGHIMEEWTCSRVTMKSPCVINVS
jgi:hypothetical protein